MRAAALSEASAGPAERVDPSSPTDAVQLAADPHRRVFVIYLDIEHVEYGGSHNVMEPLIDFMKWVPRQW